MIQTVNIFTHGPHDSLGLLPQALQQMGVAYHVVDVSDLSQDLPHVADVAWAMFLGSPESAYDDDLPWLAREISYLQMLYQAQVPILGICFGSQVLARSLGGTIEAANLQGGGAAVTVTLPLQALEPEGHEDDD